jgi:hypothetical protein
MVPPSLLGLSTLTARRLMIIMLMAPLIAGPDKLGALDR